jgi:hypothetical protein
MYRAFAEFILMTFSPELSSFDAEPFIASNYRTITENSEQKKIKD